MLTSLEKASWRSSPVPPAPVAGISIKQEGEMHKAKDDTEASLFFIWLKAQNFIHFLHYEAQPPGSDAAEKMMFVWW